MAKKAKKETKTESKNTEAVQNADATAVSETVTAVEQNSADTPEAVQDTEPAAEVAAESESAAEAVSGAENNGAAEAAPAAETASASGTVQTADTAAEDKKSKTKKEKKEKPAKEKPAKEKPVKEKPVKEKPVKDEKAEKAEAPKEKRGLGFHYHNYLERLQLNGRTLAWTVLFIVCLMGAASVGVFFWMVKSPEEVLVDNYIGLNLEDALLKMQVKELYPKIQLRYSDLQNNKGTVLEQDPPSGTISKAGRRITLTVSRGIVVDRVGNYIGQKVDDVRLALQTLFSGSTPLIRMPDKLMYVSDESEPGTILEQDPPADTLLSSPVELSLIVSSGPGDETTKVPWLVGYSLNDALLMMSRYKVIYTFTRRLPRASEKAGTIVSQTSPGNGEEVNVYSHAQAVIALPDEVVDGTVYGIYETTLPAYPYALSVRLDVIPPEGDSYSLVTLRHTGGLLTIPYAVPQFSELVLYVQDSEVGRTMAQ
ncbi:MAG: PASTA domain-containing protein [Treponemataceae bacterium]|nr:PASTA domain-containing protein [Treponemataceae bacterium]